MTNVTDPRKEFGRIVGEIAETDDRIVVLSADSGNSSGFGEFMKTYPDRYYEFGIMEQGVTGIAAGMATTGLVPVFAAIAPFVTARNFEMARNDAGYMRQNVKLVGRNGGFTYSDLGSTHHSLEDYTIMRMIPELVVFAPSDPGEIRSCARTMIEHEGPTYTRIGVQGLPDLFGEEPIVIGKGRKYREGSDVTMITTGYTTVNTVEAVDELEKAGVSVDLIGIATPSHPDVEMIVESAARTRAVVTVEEHYNTGGLGGLVAEILSSHQPTYLKQIGVPHAYAPSGPYPGLLEYAGIDPAGIVGQTQEFLSEHK